MYDAVAQAREMGEEAKRLRGEKTRAKLQVKKIEARLQVLHVEVHELLEEHFYTTADVMEKLGLEYREVTRGAQRGRWEAIKVMDKWWIEREKVDIEAETQDVF